MLVCWTWRLSGIYFSDHVESRQQATNQDQDKEHRRTILGWESTSKNHSWTRKHGRFRELVKNLTLFLTRWLQKKCFPCMPTNWQARAAWNYGLHAVCGGLVALAPYWAPLGSLLRDAARRLRPLGLPWTIASWMRLIRPPGRDFFCKRSSPTRVWCHSGFISATTVGNKEITINTVML